MGFDAETEITEQSVRWRRGVHPIVLTLGRLFLGCSQIIENRFFLQHPDAETVQDDPGVQLPDKPVIWVANHGFKDDILASVLAAKRHLFFLLASLPQFYNTFDGVTAWLNGVILANRKVRASKQTVVPKAVQALHMGSDILIFPEGVWNKSPNALILNLWPGIYRIACETGAAVVPIIHNKKDYTIKDRSDPIHTVIDTPVRIDDLSEEAALSLVRDILATWHYLMMEAYGKSSRAELLSDSSTQAEAWSKHLEARVKTADRYDREIELCADYRQKNIIRPEDVWKAVAEIKVPGRNNVLDIAFARQIIETANENDFQRRF